MRGTYYSDEDAPSSWYLDVGNPPTSTLIHPLKNWVNGVASNGTFTGDSNWPVASSANEYKGKPW